MKPLAPEELDLPSFRRDHSITIARAAFACVRAQLDRKLTPAQHAAIEWPNDRDVQIALRAAAPPLDTTSGLVVYEIATAMLPILVPYSAAAELFRRGFSISLGVSAGVRIPGIAPTGAGAQFVAEGQPKPVVQGSTSGPLLGPHKVAGITVASSELFSLAGVETLLRGLLAESSGIALDAVVFSNQAASAAHPAGLLAAGTPVNPATGAGTDLFATDVKSLADAIGPVSGAGGISFVASPGQVESARYRVPGIAPTLSPWIASSQVPPGTVIAVANNAIASAIGVPEFETSTVATLQMQDAPTTLMAGPTNSLWQTASVGVKMILPATWGVRAPNAVAYSVGVGW